MEVVDGVVHGSLGDTSIAALTAALPTADDPEPESGATTGAFSFAAVAAGKNRKQTYKWLVYVHSSATERKVLSRESWEFVCSRLDQLSLDEIMRATPERPPPAIMINERFLWRESTGILCCVDQPTHVWVKEALTRIRKGSELFRGYAKGEDHPGMFHASVIMPESMNKYSAELMLKALMFTNRIKGEYRIISLTFVGKSRLLRFWVDKSFISALNQVEFKPFVGTHRLEVAVVGHHRLRPKHKPKVASGAPPVSSAPGGTTPSATSTTAPTLPSATVVVPATSTPITTPMASQPTSPTRSTSGRPAWLQSTLLKVRTLPKTSSWEKETEEESSHMEVTGAGAGDSVAPGADPDRGQDRNTKGEAEASLPS